MAYTHAKTVFAAEGFTDAPFHGALRTFAMGGMGAQSFFIFFFTAKRGDVGGQ